MSVLPVANQPLQALNTMALPATARWYVRVEDDQQVREALALAQQLGLPLMPLGGGSNVVLHSTVEALVLHLSSRGIRLLSDGAEGAVVEAEAGEAWQSLVSWTLARDLFGLENLSLIPGTVGAAPVQNIGAYGVELADVFAGLTAMHSATGELREFSLQDCAFGYRESLFKGQQQPWIILRVRVRLGRLAQQPNLSYAPLRQYLTAAGIERPTALQVAKAVSAIRQDKLPDPAQLGNAGSFFANPLVSADKARQLKAEYPDLVTFVQPDGRVKLAAGWLIERAGWKGYRQGPVGVHQRQALVLVNHGGANGEQVLALAGRIQADIAERFGVRLHIEPKVV